MKRCWKCAEEIQDEAVACRFCHANQTSLDRYNYLTSANATGSERPIIVQAGPKQNSFQSCMGCVGGVVIALLILIVIGNMLGP